MQYTSNDKNKRYHVRVMKRCRDRFQFQIFINIIKSKM